MPSHQPGEALPLEEQGSKTDPETPGAQARRKAGAVFVIAFVFVQLAAFLTIGEVYPFSISPMFDERVWLDCEYEVLSPDGTRLPLEDFLLHQVYDGNPVGLGVGLVPPATLDQPNRIPSQSELERHVQERLIRFPELPWVTVTQTVIEKRGRTVGPRPEPLEIQVFQPTSL